MSAWFVGFAIALMLAGGWLGWTWFVRYFQGRIDEPQNADSAAIMLIGGAVALFAIVSLVAWQVLEWLRMP